MEITNPLNLKEKQLKKDLVQEALYRNNLDKIDHDEDFENPDFEQESIKERGVDFLKDQRKIPLGRLINKGKPFFMHYPKLQEKSYQVYTFVSPMGAGKCQLEYTYCRTYEYGLITAKEMHDLFHQGKEIHILAYQDRSKPIWSKITDAMYSGEKELHRVIVEGGSRIEVSMDHIMLVWRDGIKSVRLKDVTTDDWVLFPKKIDAPEWSDPVGEDHARICGIFIADGWAEPRQGSIVNIKYIDFIHKYLKQQDIAYSEVFRNNCWHVKFGASIRKLLRNLGLEVKHHYSANKTVPAWIFTNKAYMRAFIQGLVECDGSFTTQGQGKDRKGKQRSGKRHRIELMMKSRQVVNSVAQMLLSYGIRSNYRTKLSRATNSNMDWQEYYVITINGNDNLKRYLDNIPAYTDYQKDRIKDWDISADHNSNMRYNLGSYMDKAAEAMRELKIAGNYWDYIKKKQLPSDNHRFRDLLSKLDKGGYEDLANDARWIIDNYYMAKIKSIESIGVEKAYDFEVKAQNFLAGDGCGMFVHNSTNVRNFIYFHTKLEPDCINIIFDPMKMEFSMLNEIPKKGTEEYKLKQKYLLNDTFIDPITHSPMLLKITPDTVPVFHVIPRFALNRERWVEEEMGYEKTYDKTTIEILRKHGGFVFAEDISRMSEEQLFNCLNYRELRSEQAVHFFLRAAFRICDNKHGMGNWYIDHMIKVLRDSVKKFSNADEITEIDILEMSEDKGNLSSQELQLIEQLEKYKDAGFFIRNDEERRKYSVDWRRFIRLDKTINISFMGFKKTDKIGEDLVVGQSDLILERLIEISNEYYDATRKVKAHLPINDWEKYLLKKWNVSLFFEESEIFVPNDCNKQSIKKWPCIKRLDYLMSFGRKYGFKNFAFITQRITKVNPIVFKESSHLFLGPIIGEERDQILSDFGVNKVKFRMYGKDGQEKVVALRDIVTGLDKDKHEWVFIDKGRNTIAAIQTFDSPCG